MSRLPALRAVAVALTLSSALLLAGCAKSIVGKWSGNMAGNAAASSNGTIEFKPDGTFEQNMQISAPIVGNVSVIANGTYKTEGEKFSVETKDVKANGKSVMGMIPPQYKSKMNQDGTFKVSGDSLELSSGGGTATLTRVKQ